MLIKFDAQEFVFVFCYSSNNWFGFALWRRFVFSFCIEFVFFSFIFLINSSSFFKSNDFNFSCDFFFRSQNLSQSVLNFDFNRFVAVRIDLNQNFWLDVGSATNRWHTLTILKHWHAFMFSSKKGDSSTFPVKKKHSEESFFSPLILSRIWFVKEPNSFALESPSNKKCC